MASGAAKGPWFNPKYPIFIPAISSGNRWVCSGYPQGPPRQPLAQTRPVARLRRPSVEEFEELLGRAGDSRVLAADDDGPLHELGVLEEQAHDFFAALVCVRVQLQGFEVLVLPDQLRRCIGEQIEEVLEVFTGERGLQVLDDVELDAALAQDVQRAARLASTGVVVDEDSFHFECLRTGSMASWKGRLAEFPCRCRRVVSLPRESVRAGSGIRSGACALRRGRVAARR